jgi:hypothetical protein
MQFLRGIQTTLDCTVPVGQVESGEINLELLRCKKNEQSSTIHARSGLPRISIYFFAAIAVPQSLLCSPPNLDANLFCPPDFVKFRSVSSKYRLHRLGEETYNDDFGSIEYNGETNKDDIVVGQLALGWMKLSRKFETIWQNEKGKTFESIGFDANRY